MLQSSLCSELKCHLDAACAQPQSHTLQWFWQCLQIEKVMKALFVRKLYLWPRFEAHVKEALNDLPIEVCHMFQ